MENIQLQLYKHWLLSRKKKGTFIQEQVNIKLQPESEKQSDTLINKLSSFFPLFKFVTVTT